MVYPQKLSDPAYSLARLERVVRAARPCGMGAACLGTPRRNVGTMVHSRAKWASLLPGPGPRLDAQARERPGRQLQALYAPVFDEAFDPRITALIQLLEIDKHRTGRH